MGARRGFMQCMNEGTVPWTQTPTGNWAQRHCNERSGCILADLDAASATQGYTLDFAVISSTATVLVVPMW